MKDVKKDVKAKEKAEKRKLQRELAALRKQVKSSAKTGGQSGGAGGSGPGGATSMEVMYISLVKEAVKQNWRYPAIGAAENIEAAVEVTMDADGQHQPEEIEKLVLPILNDQSDIVIGSRILGKREKDSIFRIIGVYMFSWLISLLLGKKITDPSSGFRAFKMNAMNSIQLSEDQYHTSELIIEAVKKGFRLKEVPVSILKRKFGKSKKGRDLTYGFHFAKTIIKAWWR